MAEPELTTRKLAQHDLDAPASEVLLEKAANLFEALGLCAPQDPAPDEGPWQQMTALGFRP